MDEEVSSEMSDPSLVQQPSEQQQPQQTEHDGTTSGNVAMTTTAESSSSSKPKSLSLMVRILRWYVRFSSSALNQDKLLKLLQWSLTLLCKGKPWPQKLALEISFARYVTRLVGLPVALEAAVNDSWALSKDVFHYKWIGRILAYSMVMYYPTEHMAYALWMKPKSSNEPQLATKRWTAETWSYVSCRFWLAYIVAEMGQSLLQIKEKPSCVNSKLQLTRNALFLLPCIDWAKSDWDTKPWLKKDTVNYLMWAEAVVSMYQAWRNTSEDF